MHKNISLQHSTRTKYKKAELDTH